MEDVTIPSSHQRGVALVIVLAFVVLLSALIVAYLGRTATTRQLAHGTFSENRADILARSALDVIVGDLKQEIVSNSNKTTDSNGNNPVYAPNANANVIAQRSGNPSFVGAESNDPIPNLIRRSVRNDSLAVPSRASAINSYTDGSANGRSISLNRWNKHYLIPRQTGANPTDTTPIGAFVAPDWVLVSRNGPAVETSVGSGNNAVFNSTPTNTNYILGRYAYAIYDEGGLIDMNVAGYPSNSDATTVSHKGVLAFANLQAPAVNISAGGVDDVVGWRNYATAQPAGTFASFNFDTTAAGRYIAGVLSTTNGFVTVAPGTWNNGTNQAFTSRQNLLNFRSSSGFTANALQYLGTFSRDTNIPTLPSSLAMRVTSTFTRRDGTQAQVGELLLRRFPISELGWIGPGGVVAPGTAATVQRDFGLVWNVDHWDYDGPAGISPAPAIQSPLLTTRDPNFFELLAFAEASTDIRAILSLGASIIDQYDSDSITTQIAYFDTASSTVMRAYGVETVPAPPPAPPPPPGAVVINRAFHTVGEFGYAYKTSVATLNFYTVAPNDGAVLDLFTVTPATVYSGVINLNTRNYPALAAALNGALRREGSSAKVNGPNSTKAATDFANAAALLQALGRQDIPRLTASVTHSALGNSEEEQELVARSLGEITQVRTWNLMIDVIAQSGRYPPNAGSGPNTSNPLANFVVEGEKRYWLHIAIDRFTGEVIDQQLEAVYE